MFHKITFISHILVVSVAIIYYLFKVRIKDYNVPTLQLIGNELLSYYSTIYNDQFYFAAIDLESASLGVYKFTIKNKLIEKLKIEELPASMLKNLTLPNKPMVTFQQIFDNLDGYYFDSSNQTFERVKNRTPIIDVINNKILSIEDSLKTIPIFLNSDAPIDEKIADNQQISPLLDFDNANRIFIGQVSHFCLTKDKNTPIDMHKYKKFFNTPDSLKNFRNMVTHPLAITNPSNFHPFIYFNCANINDPKLSRCKFNEYFSTKHLECREKTKLMRPPSNFSIMDFGDKKKTVFHTGHGTVLMVIEYEDKPLGDPFKFSGMVEYDFNKKFISEMSCDKNETLYQYNFENKIERNFSIPNSFYNPYKLKCEEMQTGYIDEFSLGPIHSPAYNSLSMGFSGYFSTANPKNEIQSRMRQSLPNTLVIIDSLLDEKHRSAEKDSHEKITLNLIPSATQPNEYFEFEKTTKPKGDTSTSTDSSGKYVLKHRENKLIIYKNKFYEIKNILKNGEYSAFALAFVYEDELKVNPFETVVWSKDRLRCATVISNTVVDLTILDIERSERKFDDNDTFEINKRIGDDTDVNISAINKNNNMENIPEQFKIKYNKINDDFNFTPSWIAMKNELIKTNNTKQLKNIIYFDIIDLYENLNSNQYHIVDGNNNANEKTK